MIFLVDILLEIAEYDDGDVNRESKVPTPPAGHKWKQVRHDNTVSRPDDADLKYAACWVSSKSCNTFLEKKFYSSHYYYIVTKYVKSLVIFGSCWVSDLIN